MYLTLYGNIGLRYFSTPKIENVRPPKKSNFSQKCEQFSYRRRPGRSGRRCCYRCCCRCMLFYDYIYIYIYKYIYIYIATGSRFEISAVDLRFSGVNLRFRQSIWDLFMAVDLRYMAVDLRDFLGFWIIGARFGDGGAHASQDPGGAGAQYMYRYIYIYIYLFYSLYILEL